MATTAETYIADAELEKQIAAVQTAEDDATRGRSLALLTVLLSRASEQNFSTIRGIIPLLTELTSSSSDQLVQVSRSLVATAATGGAACCIYICTVWLLQCSHMHARRAHVIAAHQHAVCTLYAPLLCAIAARPMQLLRWQQRLRWTINWQQM